MRIQYVVLIDFHADTRAWCSISETWHIFQHSTQRKRTHCAASYSIQFRERERDLHDSRVSLIRSLILPMNLITIIIHGTRWNVCKMLLVQKGTQTAHTHTYTHVVVRNKYCDKYLFWILVWGQAFSKIRKWSSFFAHNLELSWQMTF